MSHAALEPESADEHPWELKRRTLPAKGHLTCNLPLSDSKYYFEGITKNIRKPALLQTSICNYGEHALGDNLLIDELVDGSREPHPPLYPVGWGWNCSGCTGNITVVEIFNPKQIQRSAQHNHIGSAAGTNHSLIVSDAGKVFSFGDGKYGQLGYGNKFINEQVKGAITQAYPKPVAPPEGLKRGRGAKVVEVGCGSIFSIAREICPEEDVVLRRGLLEANSALLSLLKVYGNVEILQEVMSHIRHELFMSSQLSTGSVTTWGTGNHGELGLGNSLKFSSSPSHIPRFKGMRIMQISAGSEHVLAINSEKKLFSWGRGQSGRLGHSDFKDRHSPKMIAFFSPYKVEFCAAGHAHSGVLFTDGLVKTELSSDPLRSLSTFGRGYHGRLGNGTNRNMCTPVIVNQWPSSMKGLQLRQVACGEAHTMVLLERTVPKGIKNPRYTNDFKYNVVMKVMGTSHHIFYSKILLIFSSISFLSYIFFIFIYSILEAYKLLFQLLVLENMALWVTDRHFQALYRLSLI